MFEILFGFILCYWFVIWLLRRFMIDNLEGRYVFISGCDTGFGNSLAKKLDALGFYVFAGCLTDTGLSDINNSCSDRAVAVAIDVTDDVSIEEAVGHVKLHLPEGKGLWALVNNAGVLGSLGPTSWQTRQDYINCMDVNLFGVIFVTKAFLPLVVMEKGRIVNMSSAGGRFTVTPVYCVTKYGVESFSDALRHEMYEEGVSVHILEPGYFATPIINPTHLRTSMQKKIDSLPSNFRKDISQTQHEALLDRMSNVIKRASKDTGLVVDAYVHAVAARFPKCRYVVGHDANFVYRLLWTLPDTISDFLYIKFVK